MIRSAIYDAIDQERNQQALQWNQPHPWGIGDCASTTLPDYIKALVLTEECGEVTRAVLEQDLPQLEIELVQVAAVAVAWLEAL